MIIQFTPQVSEILAYGKEEAQRLSTPYVGPEHLLLGILRQNGQEVSSVFRKLNIDAQKIKRDIEEQLVHDVQPEVEQGEKMNLSNSANNILKLAVLEARMQRTTKADVKHVLLGILHDKGENKARKVLENNNIDYDMLRNALLNDGNKPLASVGIPEEDFDDDTEARGGREPQRATETQAKKQSKTPLLDNFGIDLTDAAAKGMLDPVVGRENEITRVTEILARRKKNNPVLIGEPGVGKSAIVEGLAQMIASHRTSPILYNKSP